MLITRHYLTIEGTNGRPARRVHYRQCGTGPAVVLVHQSPRSSAEWTELMQIWGAHFTCIAPDTPGYGQSDPLPGEQPEIDAFADALAEFIRAVGVQQCGGYGFHSGAFILAQAMKRHSDLFAGQALGGFGVWTDDERALFAGGYFPPFVPSAYGEHLVWLWNRILEQSWFFPWFDVRHETRIGVARDESHEIDAIVMEMLESGDHYRKGYGAVMRALRELPPPDAITPPVLITAYEGDPMVAHLDRLGAVPANWQARKVADIAAQWAESLAFLRALPIPDCPILAQDDDAGFVTIGDGQIHYAGQRGAARLILHSPGSELSPPPANAIAIDAPGHGLSSDFADPAAAVEAAAQALGVAEIEWPAPPQGDPDRLYPVLTPDRFGAHLVRAWGIMRAQSFYRPHYDVRPATAIPFDPADIAPEHLARRTLAWLRAGPAARRWHAVLADKAGQG